MDLVNTCIDKDLASSPVAEYLFGSLVFGFHGHVVNRVVKVCKEKYLSLEAIVRNPEVEKLHRSVIQSPFFLHEMI